MRAQCAADGEAQTLVQIEVSCPDVKLADKSDPAGELRQFILIQLACGGGAEGLADAAAGWRTPRTVDPCIARTAIPPALALAPIDKDFSSVGSLGAGDDAKRHFSPFGRQSEQNRRGIRRKYQIRLMEDHLPAGRPGNGSQLQHRAPVIPANHRTSARRHYARPHQCVKSGLPAALSAPDYRGARHPAPVACPGPTARKGRCGGAATPCYRVEISVRPRRNGSLSPFNSAYRRAAERCCAVASEG